MKSKAMNRHISYLLLLHIFAPTGGKNSDPLDRVKCSPKCQVPFFQKHSFSRTPLISIDFFFDILAKYFLSILMGIFPLRVYNLLSDFLQKKQCSMLHLTSSKKGLAFLHTETHCWKFSPFGCFLPHFTNGAIFPSTSIRTLLPIE